MVEAEEPSVLWSIARGVATLFVPVFPDQQPFGPRPASEVLISLAVGVGACGVVGRLLTRTPVLTRLAARFTPELRDEVWEERPAAEEVATEDAAEAGSAKQPRRPSFAKRYAPELLFITVHNSSVAALAALAWLIGSPSLALFAFTLEVGYEVFDTFALGLKRLEPETLIHHVVSPICILCSTQTETDFRVLCHLCVCIDLSGAILGYSKFLLRYAHLSAVQIYRKLVWVYAFLRVVLPLIDTVIIVLNVLKTRGGAFGLVTVYEANGKPQLFARTDWTQLYFWAMAVMDAFNIYFFCVIRARARMSPQLCTQLERAGH